MGTIAVDHVKYVKELYPRLKPDDAAIERYRDAIDNLPPIVVARGRILVDGYHRWQAHRREGVDRIPAEDMGDVADVEIMKESIRLNARNAVPFTKGELRTNADRLYRMGVPEDELIKLLSTTPKSLAEYLRDAKRDEKRAAKQQAWDLWHDCAVSSYRELGERLGVDHKTAQSWVGEISNELDFSPPESRQHFDVWSFTTADKDAGAQSYFGALPPQVVENLLWLYTDPGEIVVDLFAGSGTTIDVAKRMGRRVWAADIRGNHYSPHLPIHRHDATAGWPVDAPMRAKLVVLDPPYWRQAAGRYSDDPAELAEMDLDDFYKAWCQVIDACYGKAERVVFIISPTQQDDGSVVDHTSDMLWHARDYGYQVDRRIIVTYQTQQATGQQVEWARENKRLLKLYRDLVVLKP